MLRVPTPRSPAGAQGTLSRFASRFASEFAARLTPRTIALAAGLVSLGIGCYQLSLPHVLTGVLGYNEGYDDGVYLGVATRLVHGVLAYRDFVFVQPPGIAYLMAPIALLGRAIGTQGSLAIARCLTVAVVAANAVLAGLVVRSAGRIAVVVAGFSLALWPLTVTVDRTLELEPYLVLFCLIGALLVFQDGILSSSPRRLLLGGLAFGFALDVKAWGILPIVALLACCAVKWRRSLLPVAAGIAAGVVVFCLPFFLAAPRAFFHDIVVAQLTRQPIAGIAATSFTQRLLMISGLNNLPAGTVPGPVVDALFLVLIAAVAVVFGIGRRHRTPLEWFTLASALVVFVGMFESSQLYDHYAYFPAAFLALLLGVCLGRAASSAGRRMTLMRTVGGRRIPTGNTARALGALAVLAVIAVLVAQDVQFAGTYLGEASDDGPALAAVIPPGACVLSDDPVDLLAADRFTPTASGCPAVIDPFGMFLADDGGNQPYPLTPTDSFAPAFLAEWFAWLQEADYVVLRIPSSDFLPWTYPEIQWFNQNYRLVDHIHFVYPHGYIDTQKDMYVYQRISG